MENFDSNLLINKYSMDSQIESIKLDSTKDSLDSCFIQQNYNKDFSVNSFPSTSIQSNLIKADSFKDESQKSTNNQQNNNKTQFPCLDCGKLVSSSRNLIRHRMICKVINAKVIKIFKITFFLLFI